MHSTRRTRSLSAAADITERDTKRARVNFDVVSFSASAPTSPVVEPLSSMYLSSPFFLSSFPFSFHFICVPLCASAKWKG